MTREQLLELARKLSREDQIFLADELYDADGEDGEAHLHPTWEAEIERRMDEYESGKTELKPWTQVLDEMEQRASERSQTPGS